MKTLYELSDLIDNEDLIDTFFPQTASRIAPNDMIGTTLSSSFYNNQRKLDQNSSCSGFDHIGFQSVLDSLPRGVLVPILEPSGFFNLSLSTGTLHEIRYKCRSNVVVPLKHSQKEVYLIFLYGIARSIDMESKIAESLYWDIQVVPNLILGDM